MQRTGIPLAAYERLVVMLAEARRPLVLGAGSGLSDDNGLRDEPGGQPAEPHPRPEAQPHRRGQPPPGGDGRPARGRARRFSRSSARGVLIVNSCNPVFSLPPDSGVAEALARPGLFVVACGNFLDETAELAAPRPARQPPARNLGRLRRLALDRVAAPAGHGRGLRRARPWGTSCSRPASRTSRRPRTTRPMSRSACSRTAASGTSSSGCARCSRAASSRRRPSRRPPTRRPERLPAGPGGPEPRRPRRACARRSCPPCASSTVAERTGPG